MTKQNRIDELKAQLSSAREKLADIVVYLLSDKFRGEGNDYVQVQTDLLPQLHELTLTLGFEEPL